MALLRRVSHFGIVYLAAMGGPMGFTGTARSEESFEARAAEVHRRMLTVDTHVDTPLRMLGGKFDIGARHEFGKSGGRVDLPRMKDGGLDAIFFAVYQGQGPRTTEGHEKAKTRAQNVFQAIHDAIGKNSELAGLALTPGDAYRLQEEGKRAVYIGIENGYPIGKDLALIEQFYDLGARYITLCHSRNNEICDSSTDDVVEHHGLSSFGEQVVAEMNRLGMMVDLSHASDETFDDVIRCSKAPIIASHSCAQALCDHRRNMNDDMLRTLAEQGGVIQICFLGAYVKQSEPNPQRDAAMKKMRDEFGDYQKLSESRRREAYERWEAINRQYPESTANVSDLVDHIDHVVNVAGIEHVGIGTDFDGGGGLEGCQDVSEMGNVTSELMRRGYTEQQLRKIWGGNIMRVFREVEKVAAEMELK